MSMPDNPAALVAHDPEWASRGARVLSDVRRSLEGLAGIEAAAFDHIGSTSVPGLAAKPFLDLQIRILPLPEHAELVGRLGPLGFEQALGSRPDSPGVDADLPRGSVNVAADVWHKRLYVSPSESLILHVRRSDSPWGRYTVWFRDWLRSNPGERRRYEEIKGALAAQSIGKPDYDDYTRAKTAYFDEVQPKFEAWARVTDPPDDVGRHTTVVAEGDSRP